MLKFCLASLSLSLSLFRSFARLLFVHRNFSVNNLKASVANCMCAMFASSLLYCFALCASIPVHFSLFAFILCLRMHSKFQFLRYLSISLWRNVCRVQTNEKASSTTMTSRREVFYCVQDGETQVNAWSKDHICSRCIWVFWKLLCRRMIARF